MRDLVKGESGGSENLHALCDGVLSGSPAQEEKRTGFEVRMEWIVQPSPYEELLHEIPIHSEPVYSGEKLVILERL